MTFSLARLPAPSNYPALFSETAKITVTVWLGNRKFDTFFIDLTNLHRVPSRVDMVPLSPVINHDALTDLPRIPVVVVENHLAEKVGRCYLILELGGRTWNSSENQEPAHAAITPGV